jgi:hypothetical protein
MMQVNIENTFNNTFWIVILKKLQDIKGHLVSIIPFTTLFYDVYSFVYY